MRSAPTLYAVRTFAANVSASSRGEELGQGEPHVKVVDEIGDGLVQGARLGGRSVDLFPGIEHRNLLAVEAEAACAPIALGDIDSHTIGTPDEELAGFAELELFPGCLDHIKADLSRHTQALGLGEKVSHALEDGHRLSVTCRGGSARGWCPSTHTNQDHDEEHGGSVTANWPVHCFPPEYTTPSISSTTRSRCCAPK